MASSSSVNLCRSDFFPHSPPLYPQIAFSAVEAGSYGGLLSPIFSVLYLRLALTVSACNLVYTISPDNHLERSVFPGRRFHHLCGRSLFTISAGDLVSKVLCFCSKAVPFFFKEVYALTLPTMVAMAAASPHVHNVCTQPSSSRATLPSTMVAMIAASPHVHNVCIQPTSLQARNRCLPWPSPSASSMCKRSPFLGSNDVQPSLTSSVAIGSQAAQYIVASRRRDRIDHKVLASSVLVDIAKGVVNQTPVAIERPRVDPRSVVSVILGGGAGTRLFPLTRRRAKPAVPIGGAYRLIDVPMSNCINSRINKIYILTQFNSASLNRHLARTYSSGNGVHFGDGFVEVLAATQTPGEAGMNWFLGTADAVRQFTWLFEDAKNQNLQHVLILSGDHLYRMDYIDFIQKHQDTGADITISCVPIDESRASDYGLMKIDGRGRVLSFNEKPKGAQLKSMQVDTTVLGLSPHEAKKKPYIASMGIYVFRVEILLKLLRWRFPTSNDFGSEIIPASIKECNVHAYLFDDYWEDIGTIKSFFDANLALTGQFPKFRFYDAAKPIFTSPRYLPPTKIEKCRIVDSIVSHGCFLRECSVDHSIVGIRSRLDTGAELKDVMMMGADVYETEAERAAFLAEGKVPIGVGENTKIKDCIIDKNARIGRNVIITNTDHVQEAERPAEGFYIRSGITVILKDSVIKDGTVI